VAPPPPPPPDSRASTPTQVGDDMEGAGKEELGSEHGAGPESQVAQRSRWQAVLLEAGGLSAALSEESMRRLKYCLHWLQVRLNYLILFLLLSYTHLSIYCFFFFKKIVCHSPHRRPNSNSTRLYGEPPTPPQHHLRIHLAPPAHLGRTYA
jgi:hypothetical protein